MFLLLYPLGLRPFFLTAEAVENRINTPKCCQLSGFISFCCNAVIPISIQVQKHNAFEVRLTLSTACPRLPAKTHALAAY